jgi:uncharacterized membrane protein
MISPDWRRMVNYARSSLWLVPFFAIPLELVTIRILDPLNAWLQWSFLGLAVSSAQSIFDTLVTLTLTFVVFTFGSLLVAIQVAGGQLTPRIIATTLLRDNVVRYTVGLFVFTLLFAISARNRMDTTANQLIVFVAAVLGVSCIASFLYLIDYAARLLRPISIMAHVGQQGLAVVGDVYPDLSLGSYNRASQHGTLGAPASIISHQGDSGIVLAVQTSVLLEEAEKTDGTIEFVPQVGDFVAADEPLFRLYGGATAADVSKLSDSVAFGPERTMEQDPTFALRIIVDIALKALSPAINDPTTAVLAIDQLHRLLRSVGRRNLRTDEIVDGSNRLRVIFRTPNWDDFVHLACTEIRAFGATSMQVVRRLRAMIENLIQTLPEHRHAALRQELSLLDREIERHFTFAEDLALARVADSQGLGGSSGYSRDWQ